MKNVFLFLVSKREQETTYKPFEITFPNVTGFVIMGKRLNQLCREIRQISVNI